MATLTHLNAFNGWSNAPNPRPFRRRRISFVVQTRTTPISVTAALIGTGDTNHSVLTIYRSTVQFLSGMITHHSLKQPCPAISSLLFSANKTSQQQRSSAVFYPLKIASPLICSWQIALLSRSRRQVFQKWLACGLRKKDGGSCSTKSKHFRIYITLYT